MSEYSIGIKTGDGSFYPILDENFKGKKRFVLTTVNDNQTSVQIDFYRSKDNKIDKAEYIGSLVIENIGEAPKRVPEIEVILGIDAENSLHAVARNLSSADDKQSLTVSLESLSSGLTYDIPEFELDDKLQPTSLFEDDQDLDDENLTGDTYPIDAEDSRKKHLQQHKTNPLFIFLFIIAGLLIISAITFGIFSFCSNQNQDDKPPLEVEDTDTPAQGEKITTDTSTDNTTGESAQTAEPTKVPVALVTDPPAQADRENTTGTQTGNSTDEGSKKKDTIPGGGYNYRIRRGDTLWDIAEAVYGDPWIYKLIYETNRTRINDPDLIITGREIYLPQK